MREPCEYLAFAQRAEWRAWLEQHHADRGEAWLVHPKKGATKPGLSYVEAVEEALCFGWIDGLLRPIDADTFALRYSPRQRGSVWSEGNKQRVAKLIAEGRMAEPSLAQVIEAKEKGQWEAAAQREDVATVPFDLEQALRHHDGALKTYQTLSASRRKQWLYWLGSASRVQPIVAETVSHLSLPGEPA